MNRLRVTTAGLAATVFLVLSSAIAFAQAPGSAPPYAPPPPPGPPPGSAAPDYYQPMPPFVQGPVFPDRRGFMIGFGFGVGEMGAESGPIECIDCEYSPIVGAFDFHIGGMVNPRLALMLEVWGTSKSLDADGFETLTQSAAMVAAQYWVTPRLWLKGGIGVAHLSLSYDDGSDVEPVDDGGAVMGAVGYELVAGSRFSLDLQLRLGSATYDGIDEQIHAGNVGVGFNWF